MNPNSSNVAFFSLTAYFHLGPLRYLVFAVLLILYVLMLLSNALIVAVIYQNRSLHEPMYILVCSLFGNGIFGSSIMFPFLLYQILQDVHIVPSQFCYFQAFAIHVYGIVEYFTLSVMSYDRYLAICVPLQYNTRMTRDKTAVMMVIPWLYACFICLVMIMLSSSLRLCGNAIQKVYCDNFPIVRLACSDTSILNAYGLVISIVNIFSPMLLILITYFRILRVCFLGSVQTRRKALATCMPHVVSLMNFGLGAAFEIIQYRFNLSYLPESVRIFLSLYFWLVQPILDPFVYGLSISKIRVLCKNLFVSKI
ncbi:olfactory receptor 10A3-like [Periophthalmus magnuspinnatus]|uniref:olfactory receptor 10A3-like n=1 Tax=Periophthalmus magnuspinnatus TaxID=409849 RepID=UPI00145B98BF|nr:olfactory receptor 10A3-like [Periophthalmus magnuspinnatus]